MIVVSDTSVINNLAAIGQLELLHDLYGSVVIPSAVFSELTQPRLSAGGEQAKRYPWIQVKNVIDSDNVQSFLERLDIGESEAIALALELKADRVLI